MKVAYICYLTQIDTDLSFIQEAQKLCDLTVYIYVNPKHIKKSILNLGRLYEKTGIFDASIYPELEVLKPLIDLNKIKIINVKEGKHWELNALNVFMRLARKLKREADIVHITSILQPPEMPLYMLGKKLVMTVHDPLPHSSTTSLKYRVARNFALRYVNNFIIFNKAQEKEFIETYHLENKNVLVSRFGVFNWLKLFEDNQGNYGIDTLKPYILFAGRISGYKGIDFLLPAMERVHEKYPNVNLIVAGGGKFHFDISKWEALPYIEFRNRFIPDKELIALIKGAEFMVCPYTDATQSGVVMSAFTFNTPMLATNVGGLPEMIENNRHGLIVEPKSVDSIANGICSLIENPEKVQKFSANIEQDYGVGERSWRNTAGEIVDFYKQVLNENR